MLKLTMVACALVAATAAAEAFECPFGSAIALTPIRWSAQMDPGGVKVRLGVKNPTDKQVKMVDAGVWFVDPLDRIVADTGLGLDPDLVIAASGSNITSLVAIKGFNRLVGAKMEDFTPTICTRALLFEDGTKLEY